jgi:hypothetical protein
MVYEKLLLEESQRYFHIVVRNTPVYCRNSATDTSMILIVADFYLGFREVITAFAVAAPDQPIPHPPSTAAAIAAAVAPCLPPQRGLGTFAARQNPGEFMVRIYHNL